MSGAPTADTSIDRLADLLGLERSYHDIWGNEHVAPPEIKRKLIAAMGVPAGSAAEIAASLAHVEQAPWRRLAPPCVTLLVTEPPVLRLSLPAGADRVEWRLVTEDGSERHGVATLGDLPGDEETLLDGARLVRRTLSLPTLAVGYHRIELAGGGRTAATRLIVAPPACFTADDALGPGGRGWGVAVQLYSVRSASNWGMGDFGDLLRLVETMAAFGCDTVGLNPLHALFPDDPNHYGPYGPSNRVFLNILYLAVPELPEFADCAAARALVADASFQRRLAAARAAELIDHAAVAALKVPVLEQLYQTFRATHLGRSTERGRAFEKFRAEASEALHRQALFDALHEHFYRQQGKWYWPDWPAEYRSPTAAGAVRFAAEHGERIGFFEWLQFAADAQLAAAAARARALGMELGLYRDLAVANHPGGAAAWSFPDVVLKSAGIGAPPDALGPQGQSWGLSPLSPLGLQETGYLHFIEGLRANMRSAGVIRIDHVMALLRLFWIAEGHSAAEGVYVRYPFTDLMRILALESQRSRCLVVGEDLGTVPEGFRPAMRALGVLSTRVLYFERGPDGGFIAPEHYETEAQVNAATHDLPTIRGFWQGLDIVWRDRIGLYPDPARRDADLAERRQDRERLVASLRHNGALGAHEVPTRDDGATDELVVAVHRYLARTNGRLLMVQVEDLVGEIEQPNLPGTVAEHPNWRRKLALPLEQFATDPRVRAVAGAAGLNGRG